MTALRVGATAAAAALSVLATSADAFAQSSSTDPVLIEGPTSTGQRSDLTANMWREGADERKRDRSIPDFAFEFRFGPYWPQVDDEFAAPGPYERIFDNDAQFYFGLELDWLPLRIPYVGGFGPGFGWGITSASAFALDPVTSQPTTVETSLTIMPMHLSAVLRADELMRRTGVPVVPYAKLGLGLATWSASTTSGTSRVDCQNPDDEDTCVLGEDTTFGVHMALGAALSLHWIDPARSRNLNELGIAHLYLFGEWMNAMLNGLGSRPQMNVGTSTFVGGVALDF